MRNLPAIGFGLVLIIAALILAARTAEPETTARPQVAQAVATAMHTTPSATPLPTNTLLPSATPSPTARPTATPTPLRITRLKPSQAEILALLFQYPYKGVRVNVKSARVKIESATVNGMQLLLITGEQLQAQRDEHPVSGAFGAILHWKDGEYQVRFMYAVFGRDDLSAVFTTRAGGGLVLRLQPQGQGVAGENVSPQSIFLRPCDSSVQDNPPSDMTDSQCY